MAKNEIELPEGARLVITKDEHGPQEVYDRLPTAQKAFIVTFNLPKAGGSLLAALEGASQLESLVLVTNIPNWWTSYSSESARRRGRDAVKASVDRLSALAMRAGVEIYFTRRNHSKIYVVDDIGYIGSSNFSDESANNIEAGVVVEDEEALEELRLRAWELLKPEAKLHPTLVDAVADSLADWLQDELNFESIATTAHDWDSYFAQESFKSAVERLLELARRAEGILDDARDERWAAPLQAVIQEATTLDEIGEVVAHLEYSHGSIRSCIDYSFQAAIERHITENCSDEDTLEMWQENGQRVAEERWEELRATALKDLRKDVAVLVAIRDRLIDKLRHLQEPVDNTR